MKINLCVIFGGKSTEHEISIISALQCIENIDKEKYNVIPLYMSKENDFYVSDENLLIDSKNYRNTKELLNKCVNVIFVKDKNKVYLRNKENKLFGKKTNLLVDVAFPVVHGTNVEDGNLQGFLKTLGLPIVGPNCLSSALAMDKYVMKEYSKAIEIPVIDAIRFDANDYKNIDDVIKKVEEKFSYPVIVKPVNLGSSIGIKKAKDRDGLKDALSLAFTFADIVLVEKAIVNMREINCAVIGDKYECSCSCLEEPFGNDEILSFADKYMGGSKSKVGGSKGNAKMPVNVGTKGVGAKSGMASLTRKVPADIDDKLANEIKKYAMKLFKYMGLSGVARVDFIIDKDENKVYVNEINSIPGSLSYYLFEPMGIKYKELIEKLIKIGLDSYRREENLSFVFESKVLG